MRTNEQTMKRGRECQILNLFSSKCLFSHSHVRERLYKFESKKKSNFVPISYRQVMSSSSRHLEVIFRKIWTAVKSIQNSQLTLVKSFRRSTDNQLFNYIVNTTNEETFSSIFLSHSRIENSENSQLEIQNQNKKIYSSILNVIVVIFLIINENKN